MQQWIYDLMISLYGVGISIASLFSSKARLWKKGRKDWKVKLEKAISANQLPVLWIHAASLGEFEQGRPIIEMLREQRTEVYILLTFFSPSGYEVRKAYDAVDHVMYLPLDTRSNAKEFVRLVNPGIAVFIKYEFWFNHLEALKSKGSKVYLASGRFYAKQGFFQSWGSWFRKGLEAFDHFYLQDQESADLLDSIGLRNFTVNGDTRFDRVIAIKEEAQEIPAINDFLDNRRCLILGSSWPQEELHLLNFLNQHGSEGFKTIIAPHEINESRIETFAKDCKLEVARLSTWKGANADVLFVDSIGLLAQIYRYANIAFIGGAYGSGLHNVLEPAVWSVPVIFGPRYEGFQEAVGLHSAGGAKVVESQADFDNTLLELFSDEVKRAEMGKAAGDYCMSHKGATEVVVKEICGQLDEKNRS